jgi:hypothetical protein
VNGDSISLISSKAAWQKKKTTQSFLTIAAIDLAVEGVWPESSIASCTFAVGHGYRRNQAFLILGRPRPLPLQHKSQGHPYGQQCEHAPPLGAITKRKQQQKPCRLAGQKPPAPRATTTGRKRDWPR